MASSRWQPATRFLRTCLLLAAAAQCAWPAAAQALGGTPAGQNSTLVSTPPLNRDMDHYLTRDITVCVRERYPCEQQ